MFYVDSSEFYYITSFSLVIERETFCRDEGGGAWELVSITRVGEIRQTKGTSSD